MSNFAIVEKARAGFATGKTRPIPYRKDQLERLYRLLTEREDDILEALYKDMRKSRHEALIYEVEITKREITHMIRNLDLWSATVHLPTNLLAPLDHGYVLSEPYGVVLVIGPWNYPILLICGPMIGAIAAGNAVILKPSEMASCSAALLAKLIPLYLDPEVFFVVEGGVAETQDLLSNQFDYIFCTGSTAVGKTVLMSAAQHLTPCTLELGGKSPCFIHESADFRVAAKRILWAKLINLGQTCIAPDYILCSKNAQVEFLQVASEVIEEWYGAQLQQNPDLPRIVNQAHFSRLANLINRTTGRVAFGGQTDAADLWIQPTIVINVSLTDALMTDEIFGPILPIVTVNSAEEAISAILSKPKPLAMYIFSKDEPVVQLMLAKVSSGGVCINDCVWHSAWDGLPFGGVGQSGMGNYHGLASFDTFSHKKSVLHRGFSYLSEKLGEARYPPYTQQKLNIFKAIVNNFHRFNVTRTGAWIFLTALASLTIFVALVGIWMY